MRFDVDIDWLGVYYLAVVLYLITITITYAYLLGMPVCSSVSVAFSLFISLASLSDDR